MDDEGGGIWTGPRLAAHLASLNGKAPNPSCYVVFRVTRRQDGSVRRCYHVPEEAHPLEETDWRRWLHRAGLTGAAQLRAAVLVIDESLDAAGAIVECAVERRRGAADGPYVGRPARVEFLGPARMLRLFEVTRDGRLNQYEPPPPIAASPPPRDFQLAGEREALERHFGSGFQLLGTRDPTGWEELVGLSTIAHLLLPGRVMLACGIGWHGTTPFVLVAHFPGSELSLDDDTLIQEALQQHGLVRLGTHQEEQSRVVIARRRSGSDVLLLRCARGNLSTQRAEPYALPEVSGDQRIWVRYVETRESLRVLDCYRNADAGELLVRLGRSGGPEFWALVDADGVEAWRCRAEQAAAAQHPEGLVRDGPATPHASLLALANLITAAQSRLAALTRADADPVVAPIPAEIASELRRVMEACETFEATHTASRIAALLDQLGSGSLASSEVAGLLPALATALRSELALLRAVILQPSDWQLLHDPVPFGPEVDARFPDCAHDIAEAARCLALRRPAATVFHCTRVLHRALRMLAAQAGQTDPIPDDAAAWPEALDRLAAVCEPETTRALRQFAMNWRAVDLMPGGKYTETEAEQAFRALRSLMRHMANGRPRSESLTAPQ